MIKDSNYIILKPSNVIQSEISLPGSKSISNRILLIASLASGSTIIKNLLISDDTKVMLSALNDLGVVISENNLTEYLVRGIENFYKNKKLNLFIGNSGTSIRMLTAVLAFNQGIYKLHGKKRMHERPIGDLVDSLNSIGANIKYLENIGYPPINILKSSVNNYDIKINGSISSQFLTSLLISSPIIAEKKSLQIEVLGDLISKPYVDITINIMKKFGVDVLLKEKNIFLIQAGQKYKSPGSIVVEGDASTGSYFLAAAAISGQKIRIKGIGKKSIQGDIEFINILGKMGANILMDDDWVEVSSNCQLNSIDSDFNNIPDAAMTVALVALFAKGTSILRNIGSWRVKETDRLSAMSKELRKLGAKIEEGKDFIIIEPPNHIKDATIDTYDDHRMAMCFSLASLNSFNKDGAKIRINDPNCVSKTFPNYFDFFKKILN